MSSYVISSGVTASYGLQAGDTLTVLSGGTDSGSTVAEGAQVLVSSGGSAFDEVIGGTVVVSRGGSVGAETVTSGGMLSLSAGAVAASVGVSSGGLLVGAGVVSGSVTVYDGATISGVRFAAGARDVLYYSGSESDVTLGRSATLDLAGAPVFSGETVVVGRVQSQTTVSGATLSSGAMLTTDYVQILGGGVEIVESGGLATGTDVVSGGRVEIASGGVLSGGQIDGGGLLSGGVLEGRIFEEGVVSAVGVASGASIFLDGTAEAVTVSSGAQVYANAGSVISAAVVASGGLVSGAGRLLGALTDRGAVDFLSVGGGAGLDVLSGGAASGLYVSAGGDLIVGAGGVATGISVLSGGLISAGARSLVVEAAVGVGGELSGKGVLEGSSWISGTIEGVTVAGGAAIEVQSGGLVEEVQVASGATVSAGGGARVQDLSVAAGGALIDDGQATFDRTADLGGRLSGSGAIVKEGGPTLSLSDDGAGFTGRLSFSAGTVDMLSAGALGSGAVAFEATAALATLRLETASEPAKGATLATTLIDFDTTAERLDLRGVALAASATATLAGSTLTLHDGSYLARFKLGGSVATAYSVASDGAGGTLIRAKPGAGDAVVQAAAAFDADPASPDSLGAGEPQRLRGWSDGGLARVVLKPPRP